MPNETGAPREVRILFAGLFFFSFTDEFGEGHVGIFPTSLQHDLCLKFVEKGAERDLKIYQNAIGLLPKQLIIEKRSGAASAQSDVSVLGGWTRPPELSAAEPGNIKPFGWIVDFDALHPSGIAIDNTSFLSVLRFRTGEFYTAGIGESLALHHPASGSRPLGRVASIVGVRISLTDTQDLVFGDGGSQSWTLPRAISEVWFDDTCPDDPPGPASADNDMQEYYPLLGVPKSERLKFVPDGESSATPPFICYVGGGSKPRSLV